MGQVATREGFETSLDHVVREAGSDQNVVDRWMAVLLAAVEFPEVLTHEATAGPLELQHPVAAAQRHFCSQGLPPELTTERQLPND